MSAADASIQSFPPPDLSGQASAMLIKICAAHADRPFQDGAWEKLRPAGWTGAEVSLAFGELHRKGYIEAGRLPSGSLMFRLPPDRFRRLHSVLFARGQIPSVTGTVELTAGAGRTLTADMFIALRFIAEEGLPLTAKGGVHKSRLAKLAAGLELRDGCLQALDDPGSGSCTEGAPPAGLFLIELMLRLGLLERREQAIRPAEEAVERWLELDEREMAGVVYETLSGLYGADGKAAGEAAVRHFRSFIIRPAFIPRQWYRLADVAEWMKSQGLLSESGYSALAEAAFAWLNMLAGFGWCEAGRISDAEDSFAHGLCFRWAADKPTVLDDRNVVGDPHAQTDRLIVLPDFEVLAPEDCPFKVRWSLACVAELEQAEGMWSFRLNQRKLEKAAARGLVPSQIAEWLNEQAGGQLPEQIRSVMEQWSRRIGRTVISGTGTLSCRNEEDADAIAGHPRLKDVLERIGPLQYRIKPDSSALVRRELAQAGMAPLEGGTDDEAARGNFLFRLYSMNILARRPFLGGLAFIHPAQTGLGGRGNDFAGLEPVTVPSPASPGELWPDFGEVPASWYREHRKYHASTAKQLMERAIRWQTRVSLTKGGATFEFIPVRITPGEWKVYGSISEPADGLPAERELTPGDWETIRLMLPAFPGLPSSSPGSGCGMIG